MAGVNKHWLVSTSWLVRGEKLSDKYQSWQHVLSLSHQRQPQSVISISHNYTRHTQQYMPVSDARIMPKLQFFQQLLNSLPKRCYLVDYDNIILRTGTNYNTSSLVFYGAQSALHNLGPSKICRHVVDATNSQHDNKWKCFQCKLCSPERRIWSHKSHELRHNNVTLKTKTTNNSSTNESLVNLIIPKV